MSKKRGDSGKFDRLHVTDTRRVEFRNQAGGTSYVLTGDANGAGMIEPDVYCHYGTTRIPLSAMREALDLLAAFDPPRKP